MLRLTLVIGLLLAVSVSGAGLRTSGGRWSDGEREVLASLTLRALEPLAADPSNRYADDSAAARLGQRLFFDTRMSSTGKVSCATCHLSERDFQDGVPLARGVGTTNRRTMPITGTAHSPWLFWDGRTDSQWSQALGPLESDVEHGGDRTMYMRLVAAVYRDEYEQIFGSLPDLDGLPENAGPHGDSITRAAWEAIPADRREQITRGFTNIGKAIAAFERRVTFAPTRFDRYVDMELAGQPHTADDSMTADEEAGLRLFIGKAGCVSCHNGPRFTDDFFHNTGVSASRAVAAADSGRAAGVHQALRGEFNCLSRYSDARPADCRELRFATKDSPELVRAFKTPSLRNVAERAPFMHAGQLATLADVIMHYDRAPNAPFGRSELKKLRLSERERAQIEAFLRTLSARALTPAGLETPAER